MSELELMHWDSRVLSLKAGKTNSVIPPDSQQLDEFDMVLARLPMSDDARCMRYQNAGFKFISLDLIIETASVTHAFTEIGLPHALVWVEREIPTFKIEGFHIEDSRFEHDFRCKQRLESDFWDKLILEHCTSYADMVLCALDPSKQRLIGLVSCLLKGDKLELFLVATHPDFQGQGIGSALLRGAESKALERGLTLSSQVIAANVNALNFYTKSGFKVTGGETVLHRWKESHKNG